jgi:hypothetical protein
MKMGLVRSRTQGKQTEALRPNQKRSALCIDILAIQESEGLNERFG